MAWEPLGNRVLVEITAPNEKTEGGVIKPPEVLDREGLIKLRVLAVGEGERDANGCIWPIPLAVGDCIRVSKQHPQPVALPEMRDERGELLPERFIVNFDIVVGVERGG